MFRKLKKATSAISKKDGEKKDEPKEVKADTAVPEGPRDDDKEKKKSLKKKKSSRSRSRSKDKDDNNGAARLKKKKSKRDNSKDTTGSAESGSEQFAVSAKEKSSKLPRSLLLMI